MASTLNTASRIAIMAVLMGAAPFSAHAQEGEESRDSTDQSAAETDVIVVTGYRSSNLNSIQAKREAVGVIDAISQDQIGLLPDLTISDVARRIPGVATVAQEGSTGVRSVNSEDNVTIRGLDPSFNLSTFDGVPIASTSEDDRAANLSIMPPTVVARIEAIKTLTSDLNPHGLSGQLNLVTLSAFDNLGPFLTGRVSYGFNSTAGEAQSDDELNLRTGFVYSNQFGAESQYGFVLSGSFEEFNESSFDLRPVASSSSIRLYTDDPTSNSRVDFFDESDGQPAFRRAQIYQFDTNRRRASGTVRFEARPSDQTELSVFGGAFYQDEAEFRYENLITTNSSPRPLAQNGLTGQWEQARNEFGYVDQPEESLTTVLTAKLEHTFSNEAVLDVAASYSAADVDVVRNMSKFNNPGSGNSTDTTFEYDLGDPSVRFLNPDFVSDDANYFNSYIRERSQDIEQDLTFFTASYSQGMDRGEVGFGYRFGLSFTGREQSFDREYIEGDVFNTDRCAEADITDCPLVALPDFRFEFTRSSLDPNVPFYFINDPALRELWEAQGSPITSDRSDNSIRDDYSIEEDVFGVFGQVKYETDRLFLVAGLRFDDTQADISVFFRNDQLDDDPNDAAQYEPLSRFNGYDFVLPSIVGSYELTENLVLRGGYGRTIGRPNFEQLATEERVGDPEFDQLAPGEVAEISVRRGNPDLRPLVSDNFDVSLERYFDDGGSLVSVAVFYKDIDDLIFTQRTVDENFVVDGQTVIANISQPQNSDSSSIYGVEVGIRKDFANTLPAPFDGLIFDGNFTWIGSEFTLLDPNGNGRELPGWEDQPEFLANLSLAYEAGPFGAKVAYNYVSEFLSEVTDNDGDIYDIYRENRGVWDIQGRYQVNDSLRLIAEVQNLTEEGVSYTRDIPTFGRIQAVDAERGRTVWLGVSWTPGL